MKDRKNIIVSLLLIIFLALFVYVYMDKSNVIYLGTSTKVVVKNNNIKVYDNNKNLNLTKSKIYFNNSFIDGYIKSVKTDINNKAIIYNVYNSDGRILRLYNDLFAYTGKSKITVADTNELDLLSSSDIDSIYKFLGSEDGNGIELTFSTVFKSNKKIIYDLDSDGDYEYIYSVEVVNGDSDYYSYVYIVDDDKNILVQSEKGEVDNQSTKRVSYSKLVDFNNDGKYEIVLKINTGDYGISKYRVYSYDGKVKEIK